MAKLFIKFCINHKESTLQCSNGHSITTQAGYDKLFSPHATHRYHKIALLVLFVQDVGDIWLELSKTIFYFKVRDGKEDNRVVNLANASFAVFTIEW